jgi:mannose-6-phosphate isomerase-like protein (cupin superfamily)
MTVKASGEETEQGLGLLEQTLPAGFAPPLHVHHAEDEAFYVLQGQMKIVCGDAMLHAPSGAFVLLPRGLAHGFKVEGDQPCRLLQLNWPAGLERFFEEAGQPATSLSAPPTVPTEADIQKMLSVAGKYNVEIVGPPLS